jgi:prevent-host-death family protein
MLDIIRHKRIMAMTTHSSRISSAELAKHFGLHADRARAGEPVRTTKYGRDDLVLVSAAEYDRLVRRDRRVYRTGEMPQYLLDAIAKAELPAESAELDHLLPEGWTGREP